MTSDHCSLSGLTILLPQEVFGCIIGANGSKIKELREVSRCKINNDREPITYTPGGGNPTPVKMRLLRLEGAWEDMWEGVLCMLENIATDERLQEKNLQSGSNGHITMCLKILDSAAGGVIGTGGQNLKDWRKKFPDSEFHVDRIGQRPQEQRFLRIRGTPDMLNACSEDVRLTLEQVFANPANNGMRDNMRDNNGGNRNGGSGMKAHMMNNGPKGGPIDLSDHSQFDSLDPDTDLLLDDEPMAFTGGNGTQKRRRIGSSEGMGIKAFSNQQLNKPNNNRSNNVQGDALEEATNFQAETRMLVQDVVVGKIIGTGGGNIKMIREASQCHIETDAKGSRDDGMRELVVQGPVSQVSLALAMIHQLGKKGMS